MTNRLTRRLFVTGLATAMAGASQAKAPLASIRPRPRGTAPGELPASTAMVDAAGLGGVVGFLAVEAGSGRVIEALNPDLALPPASVAKAATAHYALSHLGANYRFQTTLEAAGPIASGQIEGDLILRGGGDPTLDSDAMASMIQALKDDGIHGVKGRFLVDATCLPTLRHIDPDQPDHVGYNPAISGLNLNFNRVHFEWKKAGSRYDITMEARALRYSPAVRIARMDIEDRSVPVFAYETERGIDSWTVARRALGTEGARWLPVRRPAEYTEEVFRTIARSHGIVLKPAIVGAVEPGAVLAAHQSADLTDMMKGMLRHSTNLTAEAAGLTATGLASVRPSSLIGSARQMNLWLRAEAGAKASGFVDHSGLGYGSRVSPEAMVALMDKARSRGLLPTILKSVAVSTPGAEVVAKTGTLNFVSALSGYAKAPGTPEIVFAIFTGDVPRRDAIPVAQRERPPGSRAWARRSRSLQKRLIDRWLALASA